MIKLATIKQMRRERNRLYNIEWRKKNRSKTRESYRLWAERNPDKVKANRDKQNKVNGPKHMVFKGKIIILKERVLTGICSWCGYKGYTHMHHLQYHDDDPLKDTIELCPSCHTSRHEQMKRSRRRENRK